MSERIAVIGLGYVGLPVAVAFGKVFPGTIAFDISESRIEELRRGVDRTGEVDTAAIKESSIALTTDREMLKGATFFIVAVPTPIDINRAPDLSPLKLASELVGEAVSKGAVVVFESTVYPGVTEEFCGPIIEHISGLRHPHDFALGYSPERANPGDREHSLRRIIKVVSGENAETLERVASVYGSIIDAGVYRAPSIKVAEAAKVIENTQRDLNIALMNELAMIFERLEIRTQDVIDAASTKWNFLPFKPGFVGGHCISVDPYYLTAKAEAEGYHPQIILAGRRINDGMGAFVAQQVVKQLIRSDISVKGASVGILGLTFKEDVPDLRNSRVFDMVKELRQFGIVPKLHDPLADAESARRDHGETILPLDEISDLQALVLAVPHNVYLTSERARLFQMIKQGGTLFDIKSAIKPNEIPDNLKYWSL
ncbi:MULTISPECIES: nucleotide sugar dehydrogenase [unclassified Mesorhizobium]|uniref:nucleotide sugar dehydrogenase n=1 Tax=unclassified Mesorhizobium TaxID=325217 RepID=UPI000FCB2EAE|nr:MULTISPECIES: nucleotide sugar dehydrogenase [unclassified Mesorhizobium]RUW97501.1 nucleotide sugar dehydrogenase [Mesorhizobium sp. M8A.F.Ca.ET.023.01.1.1]TGR44374.1 nucleotide sugar dehydrogenase [bacterium M00.F.Ca.ET.199.01.1.1]TGU33240.1 nucleotide sugar dehydrogenase [bacterium M00.F.Ca.ET.156.01.1.1]TGU94411.1 nucleotide sugar dehydrogenase [Mesorhizobium sp. M00.F.Ca.ET.151.01.1.1]TGV14221.1 nucleotide sugar dehydrogenase [Mesorhizobium sp. M8A.F.Ca.ET.173.01.1.1]TGV56396.1 nucleo